MDFNSHHTLRITSDVTQQASHRWIPTQDRATSTTAPSVKQQAWEDLRFTTDPMLCIARVVMAIAIIASEITGTLICTLQDQHTECGSSASGPCGFIFMGNVLSMVLIAVLLTSDIFVSIIARGGTEQGGSALAKLRMFVFTGLLTVVIVLALYGTAFMVALGPSGSALADPICAPQGIQTVFWVAVVCRFAIAISALGGWLWWGIMLEKYRKRHCD